MALLSNHIPPLDAFIIFLAADNGIFLLLFFKILRLFLLFIVFLGKTGPSTVAMVLNASRSSFIAFLFLFPTTIRFLFLREVGPAARAAVPKACRRFRDRLLLSVSFGNGAHQISRIWVGSYSGNVTY